jgi:DNA (cytosine-5)-methyltransferase 1
LSKFLERVSEWRESENVIYGLTSKGVAAAEYFYYKEDGIAGALYIGQTHNLIETNRPKGSDKLTTVIETFEGKPFKYVSLFSGVGGFEQALNKLGGTCVMASEIDKYANQAYEILYGHPTVGDVTKVAAEDVPDHGLLVGGFPCQAFSVAGKRLGFEEARGTLFFEIARIAKVKQPKAMLLENVKGLISHDSGKTLDTIIQTLDEIGYTVDFEVMNSKYFGVPQNRERIFIVAVRNDLIEPSEWNVGKRSDVVAKGKKRISQLGVKTFNFDWPSQELVTVRLRDILESDVDERFYLSEDKTAKLVAQLEARDQEIGEGTTPLNVLSRGAESKTDGTSYCIKAGRQQELIEINVVGRLELSKNDRTNRVHSIDGLCPTPSGLGQGGGTEPKIAEPQMLGHIDLKGHDAIKRVYSAEGVSPTLTTMGGGHREPKIAEPQINVIGTTLETEAKGTNFRSWVYEADENIVGALSATMYKQPTQVYGESTKYRIRKLTPRECFRLQGFPDSEFDKLTANGISNSQLYKMAGNAVTVNVIDAIGKRLITYLGGE